eukprot:764797-Heterocapsa_arctica.AAC.1
MRAEGPGGVEVLKHKRKLWTPNLHRALKVILEKIHRVGAATIHWCTSLGVDADKGNGVVGLKGQRVFHLLDCVGAAFFKQRYAKSGYHLEANGAHARANWEHGCLPGRRKEEAIAVQEIASW